MNSYGTMKSMKNIILLALFIAVVFFFGWQFRDFQLQKAQKQQPEASVADSSFNASQSMKKMNNSSKEWMTYTDNKYKFSISYPSYFHKLSSSESDEEIGLALYLKSDAGASLWVQISEPNPKDVNGHVSKKIEDTFIAVENPYYFQLDGVRAMKESSFAGGDPQHVEGTTRVGTLRFFRNERLWMFSFEAPKDDAMVNADIDKIFDSVKLL